MESPPDGSSLPPLEDWAVVVTNFDDHIPVEHVPEIVRPKRSHLLVAISLDPEDHTLFPVRIVDQGRMSVPDEVRFVGPGLVTLPEPRGTGFEHDDSHDSDSDDNAGELPSQRQNSVRASRTRGALRGLYDRMGTQSVLLMGFGRGGNELSRQLVATGVRHLIGIDGDHLEPENLDAAPDVSLESLHEFKVVEACRRLRLNQPDLTAICIPQPVTGPDASRVLAQSRVDTAFSFVDNQAARLALSQTCRASCTVHLDVGTHIRWEDDRRIMSADIRLFEPGRGCVACVPQMSAEELDDALYELSAPAGSLHRGPRVEWHEERAGSLLHLNALASSLAVETWLSYVSGELRSSHWVRVLWPSGEAPRIESGSVTADPDCRFCGGR
ncbi:MAG: molybdopterin/thiamine biosynthesis adenylyltransferase [Planctomycetaceae bacterium]